MTMKMKLSGLLLGVLLASTSAFAAGSCGAGKCGAEMQKDMKCACTDKEKKAHKCNCDSKEKPSCDMMKKEMKGSCGAGKCGAEMKKDSTSNEMKDKTTNN